MSAILKMFVDPMGDHRPTWWLILDCGHWYHWTGDAPPKTDRKFPCPDCKPEITVQTSPVTE